MLQQNKLKTFTLFTFLLFYLSVCARQESEGMISGRIISTDKQAVSYATYSEYSFYSEAEIERLLPCIERCRYFVDSDGFEPNYINIVFRDGSIADGYCIITDMESLKPLLDDA